MEPFAYCLAQPQPPNERLLAPVSRDTARLVQAFHSGIPGYAPTPLYSLNAQAAKLGVSRFWVKDESKRFGLNAFKALGGSYAIACHLCDVLGIPPDKHAFAALQRPHAREKLGRLTFVTATDGNHGRGVAWAARVLGHQAVVYMPAGSAQERLDNIRAQGAQAEITPYNYDDAVRYASKMADRRGWVLIQDTAWPGYEDTPTHIMQGYTTMIWEILEQLTQAGEQPPTHLFLQAGVGSMAGAVAGASAALWGTAAPKVIIVEPDRADCLFRTAQANDGTLHAVTGHMGSMMAGLCCGEPCTVSWPIIHRLASAFISCGDAYSAAGMRLLGRPEPEDPPIVSGESGAVTAGVAAAIMTQPQLAELRDSLALGEDARILVISTEGDTDRANYRRVLSQRP